MGKTTSGTSTKHPPIMQQTITNAWDERNAHSMVNKYMLEYGAGLQHVWTLLDPELCMQAIKAGALNNINAKALQDLKSIGSVHEVEMLAAGQTIITLFGLVPNSYSSQSDFKTILPKAAAKGAIIDDHGQAKIPVTSVVFAPRVMAVMKILLHINEKNATWTKVAVDNDFLEVLTKARMDFSVAPHIKESV